MLYSSDQFYLMTFACAACGTGCWCSVGDDSDTWPVCSTCDDTMTVVDSL